MKKKIDFRFSRRIFGFWAVAVLSGFAASLNVEAAAD